MDEVTMDWGATMGDIPSEQIAAAFPGVKSGWVESLVSNEQKAKETVLAVNEESVDVSTHAEHASTQAYVAHYFRTHPIAVVGLAIVVISIMLAIVGPLIAPYHPETANPAAALQSPSFSHPFGTDATGMDVFSRAIAAPRIDLTIGLLASLLALVIGVPLGLISGYFGGVASELIGRSADLVQALPVFVVAMALVAASPGSKVANIIFVIATINSTVYLRLTRSQVLTMRERGYIEAARSMGHSNRTILARHVLPNSMGPMLVQLSVNVGWAILLTAGLSFVGAGIQVPTPEWGSMIATGAGNIITGQWWVSIFPGIALGLTVFGFAVTGESLAQLLDPRNR